MKMEDALEFAARRPLRAVVRCSRPYQTVWFFFKDKRFHRCHYTYQPGDELFIWEDMRWTIYDDHLNGEWEAVPLDKELKLLDSDKKEHP